MDTDIISYRLLGENSLHAVPKNSDTVGERLG